MRIRMSMALALLLTLALFAASAMTSKVAAAQMDGQAARAARLAVSGQPEPGDPAVLTVTSGELTWKPGDGFTRFTLSVRGPGDFYLQKSFDAAPTLPVKGAQGQALPDGSYVYTLIAIGEASLAAGPSAADGRQAGDQPAAVLSASMSGSFGVQDGAFVLPVVEPGGLGDESSVASPALQAPNDQVIADDLIVQSSLCVGFDCVDGESFGFDTIRVKENNTRIAFDDTSTTAGFPANDWQIAANDSASGGASYLAFLDVTNSRVPFKVMAGAPTNALYVDSSGRLGLRTGTPVLDVHILNGNTPAIRFDQDGTGGFTPQTWDVAGNEANFFVRDVTSGSRLPFRIRPGAPTSSLDINAQGNVGLGTASPATALHLYRSTSGQPVTFRIENYAESKQWNMTLASGGKLQIAEDAASTRPEFTLDGSGNLFITGALAQGSDVNSKQDFAAVDGPSVLQRLVGLPVTTWSYKTDASGVRHMGPTAQDFYAAFGLGADNTHISPLDASGVALVAVQEQQAQIAVLQSEKQEMAARISSLEARLAQLETNQGVSGDGPATWVLVAAMAWMLGCVVLLAAAILARRKRA